MAKTGEKSAKNRPKRRGPLKIGGARHFVMGLGAAVIMIAGGVLLGAATERYFEWLSALADPPPAFSPLGADAFHKTGLAGEVGLTAQFDSQRSYFIASEGREAFVAPLYPPAASSASNPVQAVLFEPAGAPAEEDFANWVRGVGPAAVVVEFLGKPVTPDDQTKALVASALRAEGLRLSPEVVFVDPHHRPRRVELAPPSFGMSLGGFVIGLGALLGFVTIRSLERERRRKARSARRELRKKSREARKAQKEEAKAKASKKSAAEPSKTENRPASDEEGKAEKTENQEADPKPPAKSVSAEPAKDADGTKEKTGETGKSAEKSGGESAPALKITGVRGE